MKKGIKSLQVLYQFKDSSNSDETDHEYSDLSGSYLNHLKKNHLQQSAFLFDELELSPKLEPKQKGKHRKMSLKVAIPNYSDHLDYDKNATDDSDGSPQKAAKTPAFEEIKSITGRIFGNPAQIDFDIMILKELSMVKPERIISLTPLAPSEIPEAGNVKWNIFLRQDLRDFENCLSTFYGEMNKIDANKTSVGLNEIYVIVTSDKSSFLKIEKFFKDEKEGSGIKISRRKVQAFGIFIVYMAKYEVPKQIEKLGSELQLTVQLKRHH